MPRVSIPALMLAASAGVPSVALAQIRPINIWGWYVPHAEIRDTR